MGEPQPPTDSSAPAPPIPPTHAVAAVEVIDVIDRLESVLRSRRAERPEGSYSARLFADPELVQRKVMEEAFETCLELGRTAADPRPGGVRGRRPGVPPRRRAWSTPACRSPPCWPSSTGGRHDRRVRRRPVAGAASARLRHRPARRRRLPDRRVPRRGPAPRVDGLELIEMRPRDAAAWLRAGRLDGAFLSTDLVLEEDLGAPRAGAARRRPLASSSWPAATTTAGRRPPSWPAGSSPPTCRGRPRSGSPTRASTSPWSTMGGALEGVCAAGHGRRHRRPARDRAQPGREPAAGAGRDRAVRGAVRPRRRRRPRRPGGAHRRRARRRGATAT